MVYLEIIQETYLHRNFWPFTPTLQWEHKDLGSLRGQFPESVWFSIVNGRHVYILYIYTHIFKENDTRTVDNVIRSPFCQLFCLNTNKVRSKSAALNLKRSWMYPLLLCASGIPLLFVRRWISPSPEGTEKMKQDPWNILKGRKMIKMCNSILYPPVLWCLCRAMSHPESCRNPVFLKWEEG